jgi:hypothetical protein
MGCGSMSNQTRFSNSFKHKVIGCRYHRDMFWLDVKSSVSDKVYNVSIKIADDCGWCGIQGIPNGILCSHQIAALRYLVNKSAIEGAFKDKIVKPN